MKLKVKSIPRIFEKEKSGKKPNTVRKQLGKGDTIEVVNSETGESFTRKIEDMTLWNGEMIISWKHESVSK